MLMATATLFLFASQRANAQFMVHEQKIGTQKITTIERVVPPPVVVGKKELSGWPAASGVVLTAYDWKCCRYFTDEGGRRWCQSCGCTLCTNPDKLKGWLIQAEDGHVYFFTTDGRLFVMVGMAAPGIPV
jgi:hypothetical protein